MYDIGFPFRSFDVTLSWNQDELNVWTLGPLNPPAYQFRYRPNYVEVFSSRCLCT